MMKMMTKRSRVILAFATVSLLGMAGLMQPSQSTGQDDGPKDPDHQVKAATLPCVCALFPLMSDPGGTLYYCDLFETACYENAQAGYLYEAGTVIWPYSECEAHCVGVYKKPSVYRGKPYLGMSDHVLPDYMHEDEFPDGPVENLVRINPDRDEHFVELGVKVAGTTVKFWGKLLEFRSPRITKEGDTVWVDSFVAFQVAVDPRIADTDAHVTPILEHKELNGGFVYSGKTYIDDSHTAPVTMLLRREGP